MDLGIGHRRGARIVKPDIVVTGVLPEPVEAALADRYTVHKIDLQAAGIAALIDYIREARAIVVIPGDPINAELIAALPDHVRLIASYSTGLDHVDLTAAQARGILVTNTPDVLTDATADIAMLLLLGTLRGAANAVTLLESEQWSGWQPAQIFGWDLKDRILGIFGGGRIGTATAKRARAFGLDVIYHSRKPNVELDALGGRYFRDFKTFLGTADIVSIHAPSTPETQGIFNADAFAAMRDGSFLINTARGDLVDDDAVIAALDSQKLAGIGFDVFRGEPKLDRRYLRRPDALLLPHIGSATHETRLAMGRSVISSLDRFFAADQ
jgi:lactate dehydrogenase-like 2-hydroxyacid dehydrogenase